MTDTAEMRELKAAKKGDEMEIRCLNTNKAVLCRVRSVGPSSTPWLHHAHR